MPDIEIPREYLRQNFERDDLLAVVLIQRENRRVEQKFATAEKIASPEYQAHLRAANAGGNDIYVSMNTIEPGAAGRTKADIDVIRHIYLDVDSGGREALSGILKAPGMPNPHHVLNTSPERYQVIWSVEGFGKEEAEDLLRSLAAAHGADPAVTDCSRVLRLPGFRNCKYKEPHYVKDIHENPGERLYRRQDFPVYEIERMPASKQAPLRRALPPGHKSQSERDWAYAMRALGRGEPPSEIQARIERFRPEKPNPRYYAERTVSRAILMRARLVSRPSQETEETAGREPDGADRLER